MKRFIAGFIVAMILFCNITTTYIGYSAEVVIEQGIDFFYKSWDMIYSLINGGVIQTSPYQGIADQATAVAAYYEDWGTDLLKAINYIYPSDDAIINSQSAISFPLKLGMTRTYYNDFINNYLNYSVDDTNGFKAALTGDSLAAWNRYNYNWINKYLNAFNGDIPVANPDHTYDAYLNCINLRNSSDVSYFWFCNIPQAYNANQSVIYYISNYPVTNYSWIAINGNNNIFPTAGSLQTPNMTCSDIININIVSNNGQYMYSVSGQGFADVMHNNTQALKFNYCKITASNSNYDSFRFYWGGGDGGPHSYSYSLTGTLQECLYDISLHFKNVNIYVDGQLWSYVGGSEPTFTAPDVITNSDGVVLGHDVYFPEQDLYIDLITWRNLLEDKIADGDNISFDDLINGGVIVDGNDIPITEEDQDTLFTKKDASLVIDIGLDDAVSSDLLPDAPSPPDEDPTDWNFPEFPIPDLTEGCDPKTTGLTVLARIINVTNKSLPPELISMFWGICISLVILGIIKILHK